MNEVVSQNAPAPVGPYSQAISDGSYLFCSGQIPLDPMLMEMVSPDIRVQTIQVLENLKAVLEAGGANLGSVVKTTIFLRHMTDFMACNEVYASYFSAPFPARSCVEVGALPRNALIEIEAIARK
jgi:2-iminobutanoate/2-iminopropanoate deaminase